MTSHRESSSFKEEVVRGQAHLVVPAVLVQEGDDGLNVVFLNDVQDLRTLNQDTVQHLQDPCPGSRGTGEALPCLKEGPSTPLGFSYQTRPPAYPTC